jgi:methionyl-tRNA synthetase
MPETAIKMMGHLGQSDFTNFHLADLQKWGRLAAGSTVAKNDPLFPRIQ